MRRFGVAPTRARDDARTAMLDFLRSTKARNLPETEPGLCARPPRVRRAGQPLAGFLGPPGARKYHSEGFLCMGLTRLRK